MRRYAKKERHIETMSKILEWQDMGCFKGIDLNDTFVLSWNITNNNIAFDLEVSIWPESEHYDSLKSNEYTCYKKGTLKFEGAKEVQGLKECKEVNPSTDSDGSIDYGNIDHLVKTPSGYELIGEFGNVIITGGGLKFGICA